MILQSVAPIRSGRPLFRPVDLVIKRGEITVIMGKSGIGKSSLLDSIAGTLSHTGEIQRPGSVFRVFQDHEQLFPWMSVLDNLMLCDPRQDWTMLCKGWHLDHLLTSRPDQCSVGQRQRFTLLRALYNAKPVILCDEPMSGVDRDSASMILRDFADQVKHTGKIVLWVTHNMQEADMLGTVVELDV